MLRKNDGKQWIRAQNPSGQWDVDEIVKVSVFHFLEKFQNVSKTCLGGLKNNDPPALQGKYVTIILHPEVTGPWQTASTSLAFRLFGAIFFENIDINMDPEQATISVDIWA
jgi:hypothetical protein